MYTGHQVAGQGGQDLGHRQRRQPHRQELRGQEREHEDGPGIVIVYTEVISVQ